MGNDEIIFRIVADFERRFITLPSTKVFMQFPVI